MKKFALAFVAALSLSVVGLTGCGGGGTEVIETTPDIAEQNQMSDDDQAAYEEQMQSYGQQGN